MHRVFLQFAAHQDFVPHALQGDIQRIHIYGFGDKISGLVLQALNRQLHIPVPGDHNHFGLGVASLDLLQQFDAVHNWHLDVGNHDTGLSHFELAQGILAVFSQQHLVAGILQGRLQHLADVLFIIHQ